MPAEFFYLLSRHLLSLRLTDELGLQAARYDLIPCLICV